jgi:hypothetical protein
MPEYNCNLCNFNTNLRANYARHLTTKKHLKTLISTGEKNKNKQQTLIHSSKTLNSECNFPQFSLKNPQKPSINPHFNSNIIEKIYCEYCGKQYTRKDNLKRHLDNGCKTKKEKIAEEEKKSEEIQILKDQINKLIEKGGANNSYNTNNTNNTNNIQNNIKLNIFGKEDLSMLTDDIKRELIKGPFKMMPKLMEMIYFNKKYPENHTVKMINKNKQIMKIHEKDGWKLADKAEMVDYILEDKNYAVDSYYDGNEDDFSQFIKKTYNRFRKLFDSRDKKLWKKIKRDVDLLLWDNM